MKFDFVIGNPPYQEEVAKVETENGQKRSKSIFHFFQISADEIATSGSVMVYPGGRWIHRSGKGMKDFGLRQINDPSLSRLDFYPESRDVFGSAAAVADGISIVVKNRNNNSDSFEYRFIQNESEKVVTINHPGETLITLNPSDTDICTKIEEFCKKNKLSFLSDRVLSQKLFGIESDFVEKNPSVVKVYNGQPLKLGEIKLLTNDRAGKAGRAKWYITERKYITQGIKYLSKWKVIVSSASAGGQKRDSQIEIVDNFSAFGRARIAIGAFDTEKEAINFYNYCNSHIIRYCFLLTDESLTSFARKVPDLGVYFSGQFVDFTKDINHQLCELIGLTDDEILYIDKRINDIDTKRNK